MNFLNIVYETAMDLAKDPTPNGFLKFLGTAWIPLLEVGAGLLIGPWIKKLIGKMALHSQDKALITFLGSAANVFIIGISFVMAAEALGVKMNSVISLITAVGLGLSLAVKENMSNVASGVQILVTKPFKVGDYIRIGSHKGYVTSLELMFTTLRTDNEKEVIIPNSTVIEDMIVNYSHYPYLRLRVPFQVNLGLDYPKLKKNIVELMKRNPYFVKDQPIDVTTKSVSTSAVKLELVGYVEVQNMEYCKHMVYDLLAAGLPVYNQAETDVTEIKMVNPVQITTPQAETGHQDLKEESTKPDPVSSGQESSAQESAEENSETAQTGQPASPVSETPAALPEMIENLVPVLSIPKVSVPGSSASDSSDKKAEPSASVQSVIHPLFDQADASIEPAKGMTGKTSDPSSGSERSS